MPDVLEELCLEGMRDVDDEVEAKVEELWEDEKVITEDLPYGATRSHGVGGMVGWERAMETGVKWKRGRARTL